MYKRQGAQRFPQNGWKPFKECKGRRELDCETYRSVSYTHLRSFNCLKRAAINTVEELTERSEEDMMKVRNLGKKSLDEVKAKLEELGLGLKPSDD